MEERVPYHTPAPKVPRNLATPIATWLRERGFTIRERHYATVATVGAT